MTKTDEHYPLLLLYVEENGKRSEFPHRVVFADKGRGNAVAVITGAAAIITKWPAQVSSCWMTSIALGCSFILISLILLMSSITNTMHPIHVRCTRDLNHLHGNKTVHLVKDGIKWDRKQLALLKFIADTYPDFEIHSTVVETSMKKFQRQKEKKKEAQEKIVFNNSLIDKIHTFIHINHLKPMRNSGLINPLYSYQREFPILHKHEKRQIENDLTYEDVLKSHSNIIEKQTTYKKYFTNTPLQYFWMDLSPEIVIFAIRVQELWQDGGISFDLPHESKIKRGSQNKTDETHDLGNLKLLITNIKSKYDKINEDVVSVDEQGLYMATRTPCHTFFGEVLMKLQKLSETISVPDFIHKILNTFCCRGVIDSNYCKQH